MAASKRKPEPGLVQRHKGTHSLEYEPRFDARSLDQFEGSIELSGLPTACSRRDFAVASARRTWMESGSSG